MPDWEPDPIYRALCEAFGWTYEPHPSEARETR